MVFFSTLSDCCTSSTLTLSRRTFIFLSIVCFLHCNSFLFSFGGKKILFPPAKGKPVILPARITLLRAGSILGSSLVFSVLRTTVGEPPHFYPIFSLFRAFFRKPRSKTLLFVSYNSLFGLSFIYLTSQVCYPSFLCTLRGLKSLSWSH